MCSRYRSAAIEGSAQPAVAADAAAEPPSRQAHTMKASVFVSEPVSQVLRLYDGLVDERAWTRTACEQIAQLADRLLDGHRAKLPGAVVELHNWHPNAGKRSTRELFDLSLSRGDALEPIPRAHWFASCRK